jgi:hypothetical protein
MFQGKNYEGNRERLDYCRLDLIDGKFEITEEYKAEILERHTIALNNDIEISMFERLNKTAEALDDAFEACKEIGAINRNCFPNLKIYSITPLFKETENGFEVDASKLMFHLNSIQKNN